MIHIVFYFQVHQPYRIRHLNVFDIRSDCGIFDENLNRATIRKVGDKCYLPANRLMKELIERYEGRFKIAYSITGVAIEQFRQYYPEILESFKDLVRTGCVELLSETYYHSLAFQHDRDEFLEQVKMHRELIKDEFGFYPVVFRNTELIYQDQLSDIIWEEAGFKVILAEGAEKILDWRSPLYAYATYNGKLLLLLKYYSLADDIAFRFSNRAWPEFPLTAEKFARWVGDLGLIEKGDKNLFVNLFMDYETFGEHQWSETGIFDFMRHLPAKIFETQHLSFAWPSDAIDIVNYQPEMLSFPYTVSWADTERDLSAWLDNDLQLNASEAFYELLGEIKSKGRWDLLDIARKLSTSDHYYYMCTKYFQDGDVHKYFSPYQSPEQAYMFYMNALAGLSERI